MKTLGNILWFLLGGFIMAIVLFIEGLVFCITIIGIPLGIQLFKLSGFVLWPFGKTVEDVNCNGFKVFLNVLWLVFGGIFTVAAFYVIGAILHITIIGIPFGKQFFKIGKFCFMPLGHTFVKPQA